MIPSVYLNHQELSFADHIGVLRMEFAIQNHLRDDTGLNYGKDHLINIQNGVRCELAGKKYLEPIEWRDFDGCNNYAMPDLIKNGIKIDVKGIKQNSHRLIVQKGTALMPEKFDDWIYLLVSHESCPIFYVMGWLWGHEITEAFYQDAARNGRPAYFVESGYLHDPWKLKLVVHGRKEHYAPVQAAR